MIRKLMTMVAILGITASSQAGIATEFTVADATHILDGAVLSTSVDGADTWTASSSSPGDFGAIGSSATLTISGALGTGSAWNGAYTYYDGSVETVPFVGAAWDTASFGSYGAAGLSPDNNAAIPYWEDGAGNQLYFLVAMNFGATDASDGAAVVQDNFGSYSGVLLKSVSNADFDSPTGGIGSVNVIPEPGTISLMSLSTIGLFLTRTMRRRKRLGSSVMPIRSVPLCDSFLSEQDWRGETIEVEEVSEENGLFTQLSESINQQMVRVSTMYREIEKTFWNRMVQRYENRLERRQNRVLLIKNNATRRLDEFLALIMK